MKKRRGTKRETNRQSVSLPATLSNVRPFKLRDSRMFLKNAMKKLEEQNEMNCSKQTNEQNVNRAKQNKVKDY